MPAPSDPVAGLSQAVLGELERVMDGSPLFDVHTHIGFNDPDGMHQSEEELYAVLDRAGAARAVTFPMHEPEGYPEHNDHVIDIARRSGGRIVAFARLDPGVDAVGEGRRALDAGAVGLKLHPRAERFTLSDDGVEPIFALADEARVPVIVHAGRGIPALGRDAVAYCRRYPSARVILAHAGICDLAWIWQTARELPNLLFDTAWWNPADMLALFSMVPPGNLLFASDAPYGQTLLPGAVIDLRIARQVGHPDALLRQHFAGRLETVLDPTAELGDLGPAPGLAHTERDPLLERIQSWTMLASFLTFRAPDAAAEPIALARLSCALGTDSPHAQLCREVLALLDAAEDEIAIADRDSSTEAPPRRAGARPLISAAIIAATPDVQLPPVPPDAPAPER